MKQAVLKGPRIVGTLTAVLLILGAAGAVPASAAAPPSPNSLAWLSSVDTSACSAPTLTQPFAAFGDSNLYTLVPGQSPDSFDGTGWTLGGGASIVTTTLQDGQTGQVLDLPAGSYAISPQMCVTNAYPTGKAMIQNLGKPGALTFGVAYEGTSSWTTGQPTTHLSLKPGTWSLSDPLNLNPYNTSSWQVVRFGFVASGGQSEYQLYDFYADPRMMS